MTSPQRRRVGVLGAGQLALMLAEAGKRIGVEVVCAGQPGDCAEQVAQVVAVDLTDAEAVAGFSKLVDVVTVESENIDASVLQGLNVFPGAEAIGIAQDRLPEKQFFQACGLSVAPYAPVGSMDELARAVDAVGLPAILKTRRLGYDGKGQVRLHANNDAEGAWDEVHRVPCILEGMVRFECEVSLIAARSTLGEVVFYPLVQNSHRDGILRKSVAPFVNTGLQSKAEVYMRVLLERLNYVGVLTVEFFVTAEGLVANEMAPRVHNSGHWTIEGSQTSQFENHLRAILGMPLGSTRSEPMVMLNCIGAMPPPAETQAYASLHRHDYGKEFRPERKVGHLTFPASASADVAEWEDRLRSKG